MSAFGGRADFWLGSPDVSNDPQQSCPFKGTSLPSQSYEKAVIDGALWKPLDCLVLGGRAGNLAARRRKWSEKTI
jgi:hypothetical protein